MTDHQPTRLAELVETLGGQERIAAILAPPGDSLLHWALRELLGTLPERRDWLNPDAEKVLRAVLGSQPAPAYPDIPLPWCYGMVRDGRLQGLSRSKMLADSWPDAVAVPLGPIDAADKLARINALPSYTYSDITHLYVGKYRDDSGTVYVKLGDVQRAIGGKA